MSDLKKIIKDKYQSEVNPQFTETAWSSFQQFQNVHKEDEKNRKGFFWLFLFGIIALSSLYSMVNLWPDEQPESTENHEQTATSFKDQNQIEKNNFLPSENSKSKKQDSQLASSNSKQENKASTLQISNSVSKNKNTTAFSDLQNHNLDMVDNSPYETLPKDIKSESIPPPKLFKERKYLQDIQILPIKVITLSSFQNEIASLDPIVPVHKLYNKMWTAMVSVGVGQMYHRSINNVSQNFVQNNFQYQISDHLRIEGLLAFQRTTFTSRVQNLSLGIRSVPLPRSSMNLSQVTSKTNYFETGIGLSYEFGVIDKIQISAGPALRYITEVSRNLIYEFEDTENRMEEINSSLDQLNTHPYNLDIHTGLFYELNQNTSVGLNASYIKSLGNSKITLPIQWRFSAGIRKSF